MRKVLLAAAAAAIAAIAIPVHAADVPGPDVHFKGPGGEIVRGVRCAAEKVDPAVQAEVDRAVRAARESGRFRAGALEIPVAFTVLYSGEEGNIPDTMIDAQMRVLNNAFRGTGFSFRLSGVNRVENHQWFTNCYNNQTFKRTLAVDPAHTLNFYTCRPSGGILGYAYLPWSWPEDDWHHGVVVLYSSLPRGGAEPYDEGDTGTHEVGHYLGLDHTFANGCRAPGDSVADTPYEASPAFGCPVGRDTCDSPGLDPIENFMDYTDDACMDEFTGGQSARMSEIVALYKPSLGQ